jgi:hypothetical protein
MTRHDEELAARLEREASDPRAWEDDNVPDTPERGLGTTITVRLDADTTRALRDHASVLGVGYTTLLRTWVQERLALESRREYAAPIATRPELAGWLDLTRRDFSSAGMVSRAS